MAFGASVKHDDIAALKEYAITTLSNVDFGDNIVEVDYIFDNSNINTRMLFDFAQYIDLYGNGIPQPTFAFNLLISKRNIGYMGKDKSTVKITFNGISFIKFRSKALVELIDQIPSDLLKIEMIGRAQLNTYMGNSTLQIMIDDIDIREYNKSDLI